MRLLAHGLQGKAARDGALSQIYPFPDDFRIVALRFTIYVNAHGV